MEKSALITEEINIQLEDVRKESRRRFYESKKGKKPSHGNHTQSLKWRFNQTMEERQNPYSRDMYDYLKPLLKKESRQHACWNQ